MATRVVNSIPSQNVYLDALQWGGWHWGDPALSAGQAVTVRYHIENQQGNNWTSGERAAIKIAFKTWSDVANIKFVETNSRAQAQLVERLGGNDTMPGYLGLHGTPETARNGPEYVDTLLVGDGRRAYGYYNSDFLNPADLKRGGYDFVTLVHELGHGLGLAHPHDTGGSSGRFPGVNSEDDRGTFNLNQGIFTVMSYNDGWRFAPASNRVPTKVTQYGYEAGPMAFDIAAVQDLYGAKALNGGNTIYRMPVANKVGTFWSCIWDTGGTDAIVYGGRSKATIDLLAATLDRSSTGGGVPTFANGVFGGFTIANAVVIENAVGGYNHDRLFGNSAANVLNGRAGNDTFDGRGGNDYYVGGTGVDIVTYAKETSGVVVDLTNTLTTGDRFSSIERIIGTRFNDVITGGAGNDTIIGGGGNDTIEGGAGNDILAGDIGDFDTLTYQTATAGVQVDMRLTSAQNTVGAGFDTVSGFERVIGSSFNDRLAGDGTLEGGNGDDVLILGVGTKAIGGAGQDQFVIPAIDSLGIEVIADFEIGVDKIVLNSADFVGIGSPGALDPSFFNFGSPPDADDRIFVYTDYVSYRALSGGYYYLVQITPNLALTADDFLVI